jgi:hypothetical protein
MKTSREKGPHAARYHWLRIAAGLVLLSAVGAWIIRDGTLLSRSSLWALAASALAAAVTSAIHALGIQLIATVYQRHVGFARALRICLLGTAGNAMGGLPIGTTLKYVILHRHVGLSLAQITFGMVAITAGITFFLLAIAAISALTLDLALSKKSALVALVPAAALGLLAALRWAGTRPRLGSLTKPLMAGKFVGRLVGLSFAMATTFVTNSCVVGAILLPDISPGRLVFISASGILLGLASLLQTVGGIQEVALSLTAYGSGIRAVDGAQIAFLMRLGAIISSSALLAVQFLFISPDPGN